MAGGPTTNSAFELLRACIAGPRSEELGAKLAATIEAGEDVWQAATDYDLVSLCYVRLAEADLVGALPPDQAARLRAAHLAHADFQSELVAAGAEIAERLKGAGVESVLPIKGLALVARYWPDYLPRHMEDLDIIIPPKDVDRAISILEGAGFLVDPEHRPSAPWDLHSPRQTRGRVSVEIHWTLPLPSGTQPFPVSDLATLAARAATQQLLGGALLVPSREDCLIIQAAYLARDGFLLGMGVWADIFSMVTDTHFEPDWERLWQIADEQGIGPLIRIELRFACELFGLPWEPGSSFARSTERAYDRLRPILHRRLVMLPGNLARLHHADARRLTSSRGRFASASCPTSS
jgi:hypothetical protein